MTNYAITGSGTTWYVCDAANGLIYARVTSAALAHAWIDSAMGYRAKPVPTTGCYRITRGMASNGVTVWTAEYITHSGEVRYLMHAAIIDPVRALVDKLTAK